MSRFKMIMKKVLFIFCLVFLLNTNSYAYIGYCKDEAQAYKDLYKVKPQFSTQFEGKLNIDDMLKRSVKEETVKLQYYNKVREMKNNAKAFDYKYIVRPNQIMHDSLNKAINIPIKYAAKVYVFFNEDQYVSR